MMDANAWTRQVRMSVKVLEKAYYLRTSVSNVGTRTRYFSFQCPGQLAQLRNFLTLSKPSIINEFSMLVRCGAGVHSRPG